MTAVDWSRYRACPVCVAELGEPCLTLSGFRADSGTVREVAEQPHGGRELRVGYGRTGGRDV